MYQLRQLLPGEIECFAVDTMKYLTIYLEVMPPMATKAPAMRFNSTRTGIIGHAIQSNAINTHQQRKLSGLSEQYPALVYFCTPHLVIVREFVANAGKISHPCTHRRSTENHISYAVTQAFPSIFSINIPSRTTDSPMT